MPSPISEESSQSAQPSQPTERVNNLIQTPPLASPSQAELAKLFQKIETLASEVTKSKREIKETKQLLVGGLILIAFMVAGMLWTAWNERSNSYNSLIEKVDFLKTKILLQENSNK